MNPQQLPHDIYSLTSYGILWYEWLFLALGILILIVLLYLGSRLLRLRKSDQKENIPLKSPYELWRERLRQLHAVPPFDRQQQAEFYFQLSLALRSCVEVATGIRATDLTYKELRQELKANRVPLPIDEKEFLSFLHKADIIKFAEKDCSVADGQADQSKILEWLETLKSYHEKMQLQEVRP